MNQSRDLFHANSPVRLPTRPCGLSYLTCDLKNQEESVEDEIHHSLTCEFPLPKGHVELKIINKDSTQCRLDIMFKH